MSFKLRSVNTRFWDDQFIQDLSPTEKLLFLYLLTNPLTSLLGIYEISIKRISFDTGITISNIETYIKRFGTVRKAFFISGYIVLPNFLKNQHLNPNMKKAVIKEFDLLPKELKDMILSNDSKGFESILNGLQTVRKVEIEDEEESEEEVEGKKDIPTIDTFLEHGKELCLKATLNYESLKFSIEQKYNSWVSDGWKDGNNKEIKNWKTKLGNTLPHLKPISNPVKKQYGLPKQHY